VSSSSATLDADSSGVFLSRHLRSSLASAWSPFIRAPPSNWLFTSEFCTKDSQQQHLLLVFFFSRWVHAMQNRAVLAAFTWTSVPASLARSVYHRYSLAHQIWHWLANGVVQEPPKFEFFLSSPLPLPTISLHPLSLSHPSFPFLFFFYGMETVQVTPLRRPLASSP